MKPSYAVTKKARKSSRFYNMRKHVHVPNRANQTSSMLRHNQSKVGILSRLAMLGLLRPREGKHSKGYIPKQEKRVQQKGG